EVLALLAAGHALMGRIAALPFPTVAAIDGACLGGGLELALACEYRVATETEKTRLGLPEVQLGLIPGLGGTQRLPRRIGVPDALDLILTGKRIDARKARRLGLVDETCQPADLRAAALRWIDPGARKRRPVKRPLAKRAADLAARLPGADRLVYGKAREQVLARTGGHYPAPLVAIDIVREGMKLPLSQLHRALDLEAGAFSRLVTSEVAKSLMGIFFMKNDVEARAAALAKRGREVERIGVLGAGLMGAGIAQGLAAKGRQVVMKDRDAEALARGMKAAAAVFDERVKRRRMTEIEKRSAMARIHPTTGVEPFRAVDFVIEAVFEDLDVKHQVIQEVEGVAPDGLIFASNTSTIPIARLAEASRDRSRIVGMHFFSPVHKMPLLEVIRHPATSDEAVATTVALGVEMGKTVIVVDDGPGFFTSRVLGPFVNEAAWILAQGARIEEVDRAMRAWGWPVGPLELLDEVGLDVAHHAGRVIGPFLGERAAPPPVLARLIEDGRKGRKTGRGFYDYSGKRKRPDPQVYELLGWREAPVPAEEIVERCWLQMLNETARAMEDGVIENPVDVDVGVIFGFGFPPFRGGILKQADRLGLATVVQKLQGYAGRYGERLAPAGLLVEMAAAGRTFHGKR
ncbi:MAG TPA: 3-hydroxyacyl-CoA dehydrogenase NAD-binding domain-containing protein, partial [Thermoanaerobaculia bacterium]|nr:3-hydroxyacyl-CoA dehydrogenase NAD-binding domain-containing protein [Thermoanaerobaculia bacterium]